MSPAYLFVFFLLSHLVLLHSAEEEQRNRSDCPVFKCGKLEKIGFPFASTTLPECGIFTVKCNESTPKIQLKRGERWYEIVSISQGGTLTIRDQVFVDRLQNRSCDSFNNLTLPSSSVFNVIITPNATLFKCNCALNITHPHIDFGHKGCNDCIYANQPLLDHPLPSLPPECSIIQLPLNETYQRNSTDPFSLLAGDISLQVFVSPDCYQCNLNGGQCTDSNGKFQCANAKTGNKKLRLKLALGIGCPAILIIICVLIFFFFLRRHYKQKYASLDFLSRNISSDPSSKSDLQRGSVYFGVPIFSYSELEEATNNFDPTKELGDGGFGTVYHGNLRDGRQVAVKRLYENNYKRVEQFMNEVEILTRLHHKNLVSLYGCTSRHSRELLLVYEFIPNGTVADHLHGNRKKPGSLTWPIRMSIAIETADALTYLHASDIIHRDVKTNNILLDNNFCVKVADFGLSRLFPTDVTHVSTAPQGTPGYVDPEYHQCYQLTDKSDVYSFGVVLIELISSMPAVDLSRHMHEINLANLAINKIQNCAFSELIDPCLGFESNLTVRRMTTSVAELAFRCLQHDKEMRPSMDEVLEVLKGIESEKYEVEKIEEVDDDIGVLKSTRPPPSPYSDDVGLLKKMQLPPSPISVTDKWVSRSTTPSTSL